MKSKSFGGANRRRRSKMTGSRLPLFIRLICCLLTWLALATFSSAPGGAQTYISSGGIIGTVTDASAAVVAGATVTITNKDTGQVSSLVTNATGAYSAGTLTPGEYIVKISAPGFRPLNLAITVQVGVIASGNASLSPGQVTDVVNVYESAVTVNLEQSAVEGVLTAEQIDTLPINGRNF